MKQTSGKDLCRIVERHGWTLLRVTGSHHIYGRQGSVVRLSIPVHASRPRHLLKQAGLTENEL